MLKQPVNFRLNRQTLQTLSLLEERLHTSKTTIVEAALQAYAKRKLAVKNPLLAYAGIIDDAEADDMLQHIRAGRRNKSKSLFKIC